MSTKSSDSVSVFLDDGRQVQSAAGQFVGQAESAAVPQANEAARKESALKAYNQQSRQCRQDSLIVEYLPMVHKIVSRVMSYLKPPLSREDLVSAGTIGLVKAARDYDCSKDTEFKTYAYIRVRGAVIDEMRDWSFTPVNLKKQLSHAHALARQFLEHTGSALSDTELARQMNLSIQQLYKLFENARTRHFLSIHGLSGETPALSENLSATNTDAPDAELEKAELLERLSAAIASLPKRHRRIIVLYYNKELTMKQIASVMDITESRVSQLHASALFKLSASLGAWRK